MTDNTDNTDDTPAQQRTTPPTDAANTLDLTPEDEAALDRAWSSITDEDIAASIRWLRKQQSHHERPAKPQEPQA